MNSRALILYNPFKTLIIILTCNASTSFAKNTLRIKGTAYIFSKRTLDISSATTALVLISPLLVIIALAIKFDSSGDIFFRQTRIGKARKPFTLFKFRSMTDPKSEYKDNFAPGDSRRVTSVGKFLRRTKLDELPQLWNILIGDMSLVGPRPEVAEWTKINSKRWDQILTVRPGLTDPASIEFRNEEILLADSDDPQAMYRDVILHQKIQLATCYVEERTMMKDLKIIAHTIWIVIRP